VLRESTCFDDDIAFATIGIEPLTVAGPRRILTGFQNCMARSSHFSCRTKPIIELE